MPLTPGTRLGPYEVVSPLGAGGMGEVYRGRDTRLDRTVAIKILPAHLADSAEAKERFDREARAVSALNHPNICHLYDVGSQDGTNFLVMEYLEGETLADRLRKGPLPLDQFFKIAIEICEGLELAHRSGVVHRDLKPGNIMLTKTGAKLMDFGLAKAPAIQNTPASGLTITMSTPAASRPLTAQGTIIGTFQYMAPEQLEGREADSRSDMFSLGAVLYEMLTGQRAFEGKSAISVASSILEKDPGPIRGLKPLTPPALDRAISRCLVKDPEARWQSARDLGLELRWITGEGAQAAAPVAAPGRLREHLAWGVAALALIAAAGFALMVALRAPKPSPTVRVVADTGAEANAKIYLYSFLGPKLTLAPDGTRLAFVAAGSDGRRRIYVRQLDQLQATPLSGTEDAVSIFFSSDSQSIAFFANGKLKKIAVQAGATVTLCDAHSSRGGSWGADGSIVFAPDLRSALLQVSSAGGVPQPLTTLDQQSGEVTERWPQFLPDAKAVLFTSGSHGGSYEDADLVVYTIASRQRKVVLRGGYFGRYLPSGHLVYMHESELFAVPFDVSRLEVTGAPVPLLDGIAAEPGDGSAQFSVASNGTFAYIPGFGGRQLVSIYWMDRQGKFTPLRDTPDNYYAPALSPDGKRLAVAINDGKRTDIWVYDLARDALTRLTFADYNFNPIWTPDGQRITFLTQNENGSYDLYWIRADGTGGPLRLTQDGIRKTPDSWHPNGRLLAYHQVAPGGTSNATSVYTLTLEGDDKQGWKPGEVKPLLTASFPQFDPSFSPDGRWLAYGSNETGDFEIFVRSFPGPGGKWQISSGGGTMPKWSRTAKDLFYRTADSRIMVAPYAVSGDSFIPGKPQLWSPGQFTERSGATNYDLHPDGKRFAVLKTPTGSDEWSANKVAFIFNFFEDLQKRVPSSK